MDEPGTDPEQEQERLDDLGRRIEQTRAEIDDSDPTKADERTFVESGAQSDQPDDDKQDDQTIAPPG